MVERIKADPSIEVVLAFAPDRLTRHPVELEELIALLDAHSIDVITHAAGDYSLRSWRTPGRSCGRCSSSTRVRGQVREDQGEGERERRSWALPRWAATLRVRQHARRAQDRSERGEARPLHGSTTREGGALRAIAAELSAKGVATTNGVTQWRYSSVRRILRNPAITGLRQHRGEIVGQAAWPAIIDRAEWDELQAILSDPARKQARPGKYLLSGLVVTEDGTTMTGAVVRRTRGTGTHEMHLYRGPGASINADILERFVTEYVLDKTDRSTPKLPKNRSRRPSEVAKIEAELKQLSDMRARGEMELQEWVIISKGVRERLAAAREQAPPAPVMPAGIAELLSRKGGLRKGWDKLSHDEKRRALAAVLESVVVHPLAPGEATLGQANLDRVEPVRR